MMCDSVNDCGDASDEYDSVCSKQTATIFSHNYSTQFVYFFQIFICSVTFCVVLKYDS